MSRSGTYFLTVSLTEFFFDHTLVHD